MISLPSPGEGNPCNGCGVCCIAETCPLPTMLELPFSDGEGPCPIVEFDEGRYWCGLVRNPLRYLGKSMKGTPEATSAKLREMLGDGTCDCTAPAGFTIMDL